MYGDDIGRDQKDFQLPIPCNNNNYKRSLIFRRMHDMFKRVNDRTTKNV
jgi:hypothetical protein